MEHDEFTKLQNEIESFLSNKYYLIPKDKALLLIGGILVFVAVTIGTDYLTVRKTMNNDVAIKTLENIQGLHTKAKKEVDAITKQSQSLHHRFEFDDNNIKLIFTDNQGNERRYFRFREDGVIEYFISKFPLVEGKNVSGVYELSRARTKKREENVGENMKKLNEWLEIIKVFNCHNVEPIIPADDVGFRFATAHAAAEFGRYAFKSNEVYGE